MEPSLWIWLVNASSTLFLVGLIWTIQIVHYPSFAYVSKSDFAEFETFHQRRISILVVPAMLIELLTTVLLLVYPPSAIPYPLLLTAAILLGFVWGSTFMLQVPIHRRLARGRDAAALRRLVQTNWFRTAAWSGRGVVVVAAMPTLFGAPYLS